MAAELTVAVGPSAGGLAEAAAGPSFAAAAAFFFPAVAACEGMVVCGVWLVDEGGRA
jgi:hypothetical protein